MNNNSNYSAKLAVAALALTALAITFSAWRYTSQGTEQLANERFHTRVAQIDTAIQDRMLAYEHVLRGGVGLFSASHNVSRQEWHDYVANLQLHENYPGIQGMGFSLWIPSAELAAHITQIRHEGFPDYTVKPAGTRPAYTSIIYLEPFDARNKRAFGFDMFSESTRRAAMETARDTGKASVSGKVKLIQETKQDVQNGFLMYLPVYRGVQPETVAQRRTALMGFVYSPFRINDLMQGILGKAIPDVTLQIYDGTHITDDAMLYKSNNTHHTALFSDTRHINIDGHTWTLRFTSLPVFEQEVNRHIPNIVAVSGLALSTLLSLLLISLLNTRTHALELAKAMTVTIRENEERFHSVVDTAADGIIVISETGLIEFCNLAAQRMFGYPAEEMIGNNISMLMPELHHSQHDGYLAHYLHNDEAHIIGSGSEVVGLHKDGTSFPMELSVGEMHADGQRKFTGMVRDITERKKIDKLKSEFVSTVSHELRTPLTSIRGSLGLVAGGVTGEIPAKAKELIDIAYKNSERLVRLINDILDIEKIESGIMTLDLKPHALMPLIEQAVEANRAYGEAYGVTFKITETMPDVHVQVDQDRLLQVMANLLSNAAKFSPANGLVKIAVTPGKLGIRVMVIDQGTGVPDAFRNQIFQKFSQADSSDTRQKGGTGLGLSITKAIMEKMHGVIGFDSEAGAGSVFYIELPEYCDKGICLTHPIAEPGILQNKLPRILICEDDDDIAKLLSIMLNDGGFITDIAHDAQQAKQLLQSSHYDAMTLDIGLPDQDGLSLLQELRTNTATAKLPIVVVSAKAEQGRAEINGSYALVGWHDKPIDRELLLTQLHAVITLRHDNHLPRILHVEDDPDVRQILSSIGQGIAEFDHAGSVQQAAAKLAQQHYDLIVLDINLPDGSGLSLMPHFHKLNATTPVMLFSGANVTQLEASQVASVLIKSCTTNQELLSAITKLITKT